MINALHPMEVKEGEDSKIHNQEALQLTKWLEEGVFDALEKRYLRGLIFAIYDNPDDKPNSRLLETYSCRNNILCKIDAFTYPDNQHVQFNITQNEDHTLFSTEGVKNQAVCFHYV